MQPPVTLAITFRSCKATVSQLGASSRFSFFLLFSLKSQFTAMKTKTYYRLFAHTCLCICAKSPHAGPGSPHSAEYITELGIAVLQGANTPSSSGSV